MLLILTYIVLLNPWPYETPITNLLVFTSDAVVVAIEVTLTMATIVESATRTVELGVAGRVKVETSVVVVVKGDETAFRVLVFGVPIRNHKCI